jgi:hypothetical protein
VTFSINYSINIYKLLRDRISFKEKIKRSVSGRNVEAWKGGRKGNNKSPILEMGLTDSRGIHVCAAKGQRNSKHT